MIIKTKLNENIFTDDCEYFITFLTDRFDYATELWQAELTKKHSKKFKPICIQYAGQNNYYEKENYIIINKALYELLQKKSLKDITIISDQSDLSIEFSCSDFIKELIEKLVEKQGRLFILPFTTSGLTINNPHVVILGPDPAITAWVDNKANQAQIFKELQVPHINSRIYNSLSDIDKKEEFPFFISASYSTAGSDSSFIYSEYDFDMFKSKIRERNYDNTFIITDLIPDVILSPNVNAMVCEENDTRVIAISDQLLEGTIYLGNIYPSKTNDVQKKLIIKIAKKIGSYLFTKGFKGIFGVDFIIDKQGNLFCVEINPRRQGGYLCNILMSKKINIPETELKLFSNDKIPDFDYEDCQADYSWGHIKLNKFSIDTLPKAESIKEPFNKKGAEFKIYFYPEESKVIKGIPGYFVASGGAYEEVKERILKESGKS